MQTLRPTSDLQSEDLHFNKVPSDLLSMKVLFIYLWLCWVFIVVRGLSLGVVSGGSSLVTVHRLFIVGAFTVGHRL